MIDPIEVCPDLEVCCMRFSPEVPVPLELRPLDRATEPVDQATTQSTLTRTKISTPLSPAGRKSGSRQWRISRLGRVVAVTLCQLGRPSADGPMAQACSNNVALRALRSEPKHAC
jgi:hypothetical protein